MSKYVIRPQVHCYIVKIIGIIFYILMKAKDVEHVFIYRVCFLNFIPVDLLLFFIISEFYFSFVPYSSPFVYCVAY